jgi:hypothetical protein
MEPAIARTQTQCFKFIFIRNFPSLFVLKPGFRLPGHYRSELPAETEPLPFGKGKRVAIHAARRWLAAKLHPVSLNGLSRSVA